MKRAKSRLIHYFRLCVEGGLITVVASGESKPMAWITLVEMLQALESILDGADPDEALEIERSRGPEPADKPLDMRTFLLIHEHRKPPREKWARVEALVNEWRVEQGYSQMTENRMKRLYYDTLRELREAGLDGPFQQ